MSDKVMFVVTLVLVAVVTFLLAAAFDQAVG